jgi:hypothetical protein
MRRNNSLLGDINAVLSLSCLTTNPPALIRFDAALLKLKQHSWPPLHHYITASLHHYITTSLHHDNMRQGGGVVFMFGVRANRQYMITHRHLIQLSAFVLHVFPLRVQILLG